MTVDLELVDNYEFRVKFAEDMAELLMDEPEPLGGDAGPSAARVISAAIGNCLSASLLFCIRKAKVEPRSLKARVTTSLIRNENKRLRIGESQVEITLDLDSADQERIGRCLELFEDYCLVTQSVREGFPVQIDVLDRDGERLFHSDGGVPELTGSA